MVSSSQQSDTDSQDVVGGYLAMSGDTLVVITREVLLISSEWRPRMVLTILQRTGQPPQQRIIWTQMSIVLMLGNLAR